MALIQVVLRWPIPTPYQSSYCESIDFKFRECDYVTEDTNPDKFSFDHVSGDGSRWCWSIQLQWLFLLLLLIFAFSGSPSVQTSEPILAHDSLKDAKWFKEVPSNDTFFSIFTFYMSFCQKTQKLYPRYSNPSQKKKKFSGSIFSCKISNDV